MKALFSLVAQLILWLSAAERSCSPAAPSHCSWLWSQPVPQAGSSCDWTELSFLTRGNWWERKGRSRAYYSREMMVGLLTLPCQPKQSTELENENISLGQVPPSVLDWPTHKEEGKRLSPLQWPRLRFHERGDKEPWGKVVHNSFYRLHTQRPQTLAFPKTSVSHFFPPVVAFPYMKRPTQPFNLLNFTALNQLLYCKDESKG